MGTGRDRLRGQQRQRRDLHRRGAAGPARLHRDRPDRRGGARGDRPRPVPGRRQGRHRHPRRRDRPDRRDAGRLRGRRAHAQPGRHRGRRDPGRAQPGGRVRGPPGRRRPGPAQFGPAQQRLFAGPPGPRPAHRRAGRRAARADPGVRAGRRGAVGGRGHPARAGAHLRRRPAQPGPAGRGRVVHPGRAAARAGDLRPDRLGGRRPGRDHVRHVQHGHRLLRRRLPGRRPGRARRPVRRGGAARRGRLGHGPPRPLRVDPRGRTAGPRRCVRGGAPIPSRHGRPWLCRGEC